VALRVDSPRDREPHEFERGRLPAGTAEHDAANLARANSGVSVERAHEGLAGKLPRRYVRAAVTRIDVDRVSAGRFDDPVSRRQQLLARYAVERMR
jgi:hypothetical protein